MGQKTKRVALNVTRVLALVAGVLFFFTPVSTAIQVLLCVFAFFVFIICSAVSGNLEHDDTGYWPDEHNHL